MLTRVRAGDLLQLRPAEVLFEEWLLLRNAGIDTPQIAVWQTIAGTDPTAWWACEVALQCIVVIRGAGSTSWTACTTTRLMPTWS